MAFVVTGCGQPAPVPGDKPVEGTADRTDMDSKLKSMTPEERTAYAKAHAEELKSAYSQVPGAPPTSTP